jgi:hypothetical protein
LEQFSPEVREEQYLKEFSLGFDPHANARQHRIWGEWMAEKVIPLLPQ